MNSRATSVVNRIRSVEQCLPDVVVIQPREVLVDLFATLALGKDVQDSLHRDSRTSDARLSVHHRWINRNSFKRHRFAMAMKIHVERWKVSQPGESTLLGIQDGPLGSNH
jgi:hypothetical protein